MSTWDPNLTEAENLANLDAEIHERYSEQPAPRSKDPNVHLEQVGLSFAVQVQPLGAEFLFRNVVADGEMKADVSVEHNGVHLFRTTSTLSLTGRNTLAKTASQLDSSDAEAWQRATFKAVEEVLIAVEELGGGVDLRYVSVDPKAPPPMMIDALFPKVATGLVMPRTYGKSIIARALSLSLVTGREVFPGYKPRRTGPVLYVDAEDPDEQIHALHLEALCRGIGVARDELPNSFQVYDARGRSLNRIARTLAERAQDCVAVILDSKQALESAMSDVNIRDRDTLFFNALDQIERPSFTLLHPNRADRTSWVKSDGSPAGSDVTADRLRCHWKGVIEDDPDNDQGHSTRYYTLHNVAWRHGPLFAPINFALEQYRDAGAWVYRFAPSEQVQQGEDAPDRHPGGRPEKDYAPTLAAWKRGARTAAALAADLDISYDAASKRLKRYATRLEQEG